MADTRRIALRALVRIDTEGAYANLVVPAAIGRTRLSDRDRHFVTDLVYGTTRMRRALDAAIDPHLRGPVEPEVRAALRLGAYQLLFLQTPAHAAVSATVGVVPLRARGLANAVLRRVAETGHANASDDATRLSYPDWVVERLVAEWGDDALAALEAMNVPAETTVRADGYVQDKASQWVAESIPARPGEFVADVCAAPGGKATILGHRVGREGKVVALDRAPARVGLIAQNARTTKARAVRAAVGDATAPPLRAGAFHHVLVDAPCSGLGVLRRRPDARWRVRPTDPADLAQLAKRILAASAPLVAPGGTLTYSVCTFTHAETSDVDEWAAGALSEFAVLDPPGSPWRRHGRGGAVLLPQDAGTDGMFILRLGRP
ncbi:MAG TPA: transcription antitermination factor NusB [Acidimicrobiales bacterium]|nr:transcription antitermination factor NusB [Acidimicrobiales bacterium]